jgi:DNA-binding transcriptional ArsR family regulator
MPEAPDAVFAALADPTRRRVLRLVAERGPTSATLLERELPVSRQAIVKHLVVLSRAGLVTGQRTGQEVRYALVPEPLDEVSKWIAEVGSRWDERLARLRQVVLEPTPASTMERSLTSPQREH